MAFHSQDEYHFSENESNHLLFPINDENQIAFPLREKQSQKEDSPNSHGSKAAECSGERQGKTKHIQKQKRKTNRKYQKRKKDDSINVSMGRPDNCDTESLHLKENKSYNDIVYHFARLLIFLKLKQGEQRVTHALNLTIHQNTWISKVQNIMAQDNYPTFEQQKPYFLLHPNSPHYVFDHLKRRENKNFYTSEESQFLMIAYLLRKGLLTSTIYHYLCDYWKDIVFLVNNPKGDSLPSNIPEDFEAEIGEPLEMPNSQENIENVDSNGRSKVKSQKGKTGPSESALLRQELQQDDSIAAYEIACYLHACCEKYSIKISA